MTRVATSVDLPATPPAVWQVVGDFDGTPAWHPGIESSSLESGGSVRRVTLTEGGETVERLLDRDDDQRRQRYTIVESGLPVEDYVATLSVDDADGGATVSWTAAFRVVGAEEAEAEDLVRGFLQAGLDGLATLLAGANGPASPDDV